MNVRHVTAKAQILIHKAASDVFDAFVNPKTMSKFWFTRRDEGLREGETVTWFIGQRPDAPMFEVRVKTLNRPTLIVIEWGDAEGFTTVTWTLEEKDPGVTLLQIEEVGFAGNTQDIVDRALDSTGGFNQVILAAKALLEHGAVMNVVADHA